MQYCEIWILNSKIIGVKDVKVKYANWLTLKD